MIGGTDNILRAYNTFELISELDTGNDIYEGN